MDEKIKEKIRELREQLGVPTAEKGKPLFQPGFAVSWVASVYPSDDIRALGYKVAADRLVDLVIKEPGHADHLVYSIGYLYRMYIEVRLKTIIESATNVYKSGHDLDKLWKEAKESMVRSSQWFDDTELEAVEEKIHEFCIIDPFSDAFRYSRNKNGALTLQNIKSVDLKHLNQIIDSISTSLEGSYTAIYEDRRGE